MAGQRNTVTTSKEERKVPVFTVLKNNAILKNIYLINTPLSPSFENESGGFKSLHCHNHQDDEDLEETLLVGRHPDCDIRLEHPSISRFHLRIHSRPNSKYFTVTDLSSVHGTWVSGRRIEPRLRTEMNEGDTLKIGGSSRVYMLHWISLSQAYDLENPFVPPLDVPVQEEEKGGQISKVEDFKATENEMQSVDQSLEPFELSFPVENPEAPKEITLSHPVSEDIGSSLSSKGNGDEESDSESALSMDSVVTESLFLGMTSGCFVQDGGRGETDLGNGDGQLVDSVLDVLESLVLDERPAWIVQEVSAPSPTSEEHVAPNNESIQSMDSALGSLGSVFPNTDSKRLDGEDMQTENEEICEEHFIDEGTSQTSSVNDTETLSVDFIGLNGLFEDENPEQYEIQHASPLLVVESRFAYSLETDDKHIQLAPPSIEVEGLMPSDHGSQRPETGEKNFKIQQDTSKELLVFEASSGVEIQEKTPVGSCFSTDLSEKVVDTATHRGGISAAADILLKDDNQSTACGPMDPWSFWSGSSPEASTKLSLPISRILPEADHCCIERGSHDMPSETVNNEMKCSNSPDSILNRNSLEKECEQKEIWSFWSKTLGTEHICPLSDEEALAESDNDQMNTKSKCPKSPIAVEKARGASLLEDLPETSANRSKLRSIWIRRGNQDSDIQIQISGSRQTAQKATNESKPKYKSISKGLFSEVGDHGELFTPGKENHTPSAPASNGKLSLLEEVPQSVSSKSNLRENTGFIGICLDRGVFASSDKENQTPKFLLGQRSASCMPGSHGKRVSKTDVGERLPFQCMLEKSPQKAPYQTHTFSSAMLSRNPAYIAGALSSKVCSGDRFRRWNMIVDTTCLLNKESRKALHLLEGLKGTRLVVPRIVLRELDFMKRKSTFFRRKTEVTAVLAWIEECMEKRKGWMHIQSSAEEGRSVPPTPATPQYVLSGGINGSASLVLPETVSPTTEDRVLDYALFFRSSKNDGYLVLLTDDIGLKIKAMAEGLICETAEEFRESLVNPFSERFLWADSSPRGQTWSFLDDIALRHNFYRGSLNLTCKAENMKGLKLILVNNSRSNSQNGCPGSIC